MLENTINKPKEDKSTDPSVVSRRRFMVMLAGAAATIAGSGCSLKPSQEPKDITWEMLEKRDLQKIPAKIFMKKYFPIGYSELSKWVDQYFPENSEFRNRKGQISIDSPEEVARIVAKVENIVASKYEDHKIKSGKSSPESDENDRKFRFVKDARDTLNYLDFCDNLPIPLRQMRTLSYAMEMIKDQAMGNQRWIDFHDSAPIMFWMALKWKNQNNIIQLCHEAASLKVRLAELLTDRENPDPYRQGDEELSQLNSDLDSLIGGYLSMWVREGIKPQGYKGESLDQERKKVQERRKIIEKREKGKNTNN